MSVVRKASDDQRSLVYEAQPAPNTVEEVREVIIEAHLACRERVTACLSNRACCYAHHELSRGTADTPPETSGSKHAASPPSSTPLHLALAKLCPFMKLFVSSLPLSSPARPWIISIARALISTRMCDDHYGSSESVSYGMGCRLCQNDFPHTKTILRRSSRNCGDDSFSRRSSRNCGDDSFSSRRFLLRLRTISGVWS